MTGVVQRLNDVDTTSVGTIKGLSVRSNGAFVVAFIAVIAVAKSASGKDVYSIIERIEAASLKSSGYVLRYKSVRGSRSILMAYRGDTEAFLFATPTAVILRDDRGIVFMRTTPNGELQEFIPKGTDPEFPGDAQFDDFLLTPAMRSMLKTQTFDKVAERPGGGWIVTRPYSRRSREGPLSAPESPEADAPVTEWHLGPSGMPLRRISAKGLRIYDYQYSDKCDDAWWFVEQTSSPVPNSGYRLVSARKLERGESKYFDPKLAIQVVEDEVVRPANTIVIPPPERSGQDSSTQSSSGSRVAGWRTSWYVVGLSAVIGVIFASAIWRWRRA